MAAPTLGTFLRRLGQAMAAEALAHRPTGIWSSGSGPAGTRPPFGPSSSGTGSMVPRVCRRVLACPAERRGRLQATFRYWSAAGTRSAGGRRWPPGFTGSPAGPPSSSGPRPTAAGGARPGRPAGRRVIPDDTPWGEVRRPSWTRNSVDCPRPAGRPWSCSLPGGADAGGGGRQLGLSKRTVQRHLDRGRELLGRRLARRGLPLGRGPGGPARVRLHRRGNGAPRPADADRGVRRPHRRRPCRPGRCGVPPRGRPDRRSDQSHVPRQVPDGRRPVGLRPGPRVRGAPVRPAAGRRPGPGPARCRARPPRTSSRSTPTSSSTRRFRSSSA